MKRILCIGHASYDITIPFNGYPVENTKNRVKDEVQCGGGPASNAAYLLGRWGMRPIFVGVLGNDIYAKRILKEFKKVNVNTRFVEIDDDNETTLSFIIVNKENGSRTIFTHRPQKMRLRKRIKVKADVILVDGQELEASISAMQKNPKAIKVIDAGRLNEENITLGRMVDYLVCSKNFAEDFTGMKIDVKNKKKLTEIYDKMEAMFKNTIIVTLEDKGCMYKEEGKVKVLPSIKVKAVDSTGAGDFFHGAFVYAIANNFSLTEALKLSNVAGALSVTKLGGRNSVYSLDEVMRTYEENYK